MTKKTTISISKEALEKLKEVEIDYYGLKPTDSSSKLIALINLYEAARK